MQGALLVCNLVTANEARSLQRGAELTPELLELHALSCLLVCSGVACALSSLKFEASGPARQHSEPPDLHTHLCCTELSQPGLPSDLGRLAHPGMGKPPAKAFEVAILARGHRLYA